jgi:DNA-binding transcriptional MerR regulator
VLSPPARTDSGYRRYPPEAVARVRLVRRALTISFTLDELASVLSERDRGGAPCQRVRTLVTERLAESGRRRQAGAGYFFFIDSPQQISDCGISGGHGQPFSYTNTAPHLQH